MSRIDDDDEDGHKVGMGMLEVGADSELGRMLGQAIARKMGSRPDSEGPRGKNVPQDIAALELKMIAERFAKGNPFKAGDLITPRVGYNIKLAGSPHVVLEVLPMRRERPTKDRGDIAAMYDMRVVCQIEGDFIPFYAESWAYEPYAGPVATLD